MKKDKSTKPRTLAGLHYLHTSRKLWLNPAYQREAVWTLSQKQLFIDSLLIDIDIPKLYFREKPSGQYEFEVVDGQQRLRAIFDFFEDRFSLADHTDHIGGHPLTGRTFSELHTDLQMKLRDSSQVACKGRRHKDVKWPAPLHPVQFKEGFEVLTWGH